jgi:hypothetical protein
MSLEEKMMDEKEKDYLTAFTMTVKSEELIEIRKRAEQMHLPMSRFFVLAGLNWNGQIKDVH